MQVWLKYKTENNLTLTEGEGRNSNNGCKSEIKKIDIIKLQRTILKHLAMLSFSPKSCRDYLQEILKSHRKYRQSTEPKGAFDQMSTIYNNDFPLFE